MIGKLCPGFVICYDVANNKSSIGVRVWSLELKVEIIIE